MSPLLQHLRVDSGLEDSMPHKATVDPELKNRRMLPQASNRPIEYAQAVASRASYRQRVAPAKIGRSVAIVCTVSDI